MLADNGQLMNNPKIAAAAATFPLKILKVMVTPKFMMWSRWGTQWTTLSSTSTTDPG